MRVRVSQSIKQFGWYGKQRRYPGDEFDIAGAHELCPWMEPVSRETPVSIETTDSGQCPAVSTDLKKRVRRTKAQIAADQKALGNGKSITA